MTAELLLSRDDCAVYHADHLALLAALPRREDGTAVDTLIVDCPYSERTHAGHDDGTGLANRVADWARRNPDHPESRGKLQRTERYGSERRTLNYPAWTAEDVSTFVSAWAPLVSGWIVSLTDHVLAPAWERAYEDAGRYAFAPLACVEPGSRVRMTGDGPSNWCCWAVVSRPRTRDAQKWGALPGGYVIPRGHMEAGARRDDLRVVGGKPSWLMERLVSDYSRPNDLVCDPCMGAATTGVAALRVGRRFVGGDVLREHAELGARRLSGMIQRPLFVEGAR